MDVIDKRNMQEKMSKSIIKRRNVVYTVPQQPKEQKAETEELVIDAKSREILDRLEQEHQDDERKKREQIERLLEQQEHNQQEAMRIMNEKREELEKTVNEAAHHMVDEAALTALLDEKPEDEQE